MRALVLGGNRYIGLSLVRELTRQGVVVTVANSHPTELPEPVTRIHVDRRQPGALTAVLSPHQRDFDVVFDNTAYERTDVQPLVELFDGHVGRYVFTSSVAVYRRSFVQPVAEHFRVHEAVADQPLRSYAVGKVQSERFLSERFSRTGFPFVSVRVSHTIGPRSPLVTREPAIFARLEEGRPIFVPGDGFSSVHFIHIDDAAGFLIALALSPDSAGNIYNAAGTEHTSILGCIHLMARAAEVEANVVHVPTAVARTLARPLLHWNEALYGGAIYSIAKALKHTSWAPKFGLAEAYKDSYAWFAEAGGRKTYQYDYADDEDILALVSK